MDGEEWKDNSNDHHDDDDIVDDDGETTAKEQQQQQLTPRNNTTSSSASKSSVVETTGYTTTTGAPTSHFVTGTVSPALPGIKSVVASINLGSNRVTGVLPNVLLHLHLKTLSLYNNKLAGSNFAAREHATVLEELHLDATGLYSIKGIELAHAPLLK
mmetsp:Transcript_43001/g.52187  ORF Transcript_43001/g.52187 Transcript_43001/m.52187 type:complete len:158 (-) Transcript_43001:239-712(-)